MPIPIICAAAALRPFAAGFRSCFNPAQAPDFVTVLLALVCCLEGKTLAALHRTVCAQRALSGFSRFLGRARDFAQRRGARARLQVPRRTGGAGTKFPADQDTRLTLAG